MSKLVLKQEIHGKFIPQIVRSFLMSKNISVDSEELNQVKNNFRDKLKSLQSSFVNVYMYLDDLKKPISSYDDITIIIELHDKYKDGLREN